MSDLKLKEGMDIKIKNKNIAMTGDLLHPETRRRIATKDKAAILLKSKGGIPNRQSIKGTNRNKYPVDSSTDILIVGTFKNGRKSSDNVDKAREIGAKEYKIHEIFDC